MNRSAQQQPVNRRALTSMLLLFSFVLLPVSGIPLHFSRFNAEFGLSEHLWMSVHNASGLLFLLAAAAHLSLNGTALRKYIASKTGELSGFRKEMLLALAIVASVVGLVSSHALHVH